MTPYYKRRNQLTVSLNGTHSVTLDTDKDMNDIYVGLRAILRHILDGQDSLHENFPQGQPSPKDPAPKQ